MTFGEKLRELRIARGYSQGDLAKMLGLARSAISMYEGDKREPSFEIVEAIADIFNVNIDALASSKPQDKSAYYLDDETAALAQSIKDDPDLRILMDASRKLSPEELKAVITMVKVMKGVE